MSIGPILNKIQPFQNVKIYKQMYGLPDTVRKCPEIHIFLSKFWSFWMVVSCSILAQLTRNLRICKARWALSEDIGRVDNPITHGLVPRPSQNEIRQWYHGQGLCVVPSHYYVINQSGWVIKSCIPSWRVDSHLCSHYNARVMSQELGKTSLQCPSGSQRRGIVVICICSVTKTVRRLGKFFFLRHHHLWKIA